MAIGLLSMILTDLSFNPLLGQDGPILANIDGDIVLTTIDTFPAHKMTLSAADARAVKSIDPTILPCGCIVTEEGMGEVARGYIADPSAQINESGHVITLNILPHTESLRWDATGPGWVAATGIDTIASRLVQPHIPNPPAGGTGWTAGVVDTGIPVISVSPLHWIGNDPNTSNADLNSITKNDGIAVGWNVGATTNEVLYSGDGGITTIAFGANTHRMFGFTSNFSTYSYQMLDYAIYLSWDEHVPPLPTSGVLSVYEKGVNILTFPSGSYYPGDVVEVAIVGGVVQYSINNTVFYTSHTAPTYPLRGGCSIYSPNAAILGGTWTSYVAPKDTYYAVAFENATVLDGLLQLAKRTYRHLRQKQVNGIPVQAMELGLFYAPPTMVLKTSDGESPSQLRARNAYTRLIMPQVDYAWATSQIITIGAAFGGGTGDTQVKLDNLWDYLHPTSILPQTVPSGQPPVVTYLTPPSKRPGQNGGPDYYPLFPEYDDINFPIERRVALNGTYYYVVKNVVLIAAMKAKGHWSGEIFGAIDDSSITYVDKSPDAQKEAVERTLYVSCMTKLKRHEQLEFTATIETDGRGRITQAGDLVNVQIKRVGRGHAGLDVKAFLEADINVSPMVTSVIRQYREASVADKWAVSSLGRLLTDDSAALTDTMRQMEAVRLVPTTSSQTVVIGPIEQTINSMFPLDIPVELPNTMYRMTAASLHVVIKPARHNVSLVKGATLDGAHDHSFTIPALVVAISPLPGHWHTGVIPTHAHGGIDSTLGVTGSTDLSHGQGTSILAGLNGLVGNGSLAVNGGGNVANSGRVRSDNLMHGHNTPIFGSNGLDPTGEQQNVWLKDGRFLAVAANVEAQIPTGSQDVGETSHGHGSSTFAGQSGNINNGNLAASGGGNVNNLGYTPRGLANGGAPIAFYTSPYGTTTPTYADNGGFLVGLTTVVNGTTRTDDPLHAGLHTHDLYPDVVETSLGGYVQVWIDSGDGVHVDRSPDLGGPWNNINVDIKGNTFVDSNGVGMRGTGLERFLQAPGKTVGIRIVAVNGASNPTGICNVQVHGTWEYDKTAISSTIYAGAGGG